MTKVHGDLDGKVALITGAASGIARETAFCLAEVGAALTLLDVNAEALQVTAAELEGLGTRVLGLECDLGDTEKLPLMVQQVVDSFGRIDVLVNAAAVSPKGDHLIGLDPGLWDRVYAVNLKAPAILMEEVSRRMVEQGQGGRIVNLSSSSAFRGQSPAAYASCKAGLGALTRIGAYELGPHDINVNAVVPGLTISTMTLENLGMEQMLESVKEGPTSNYFGRLSEPRDVASVIAFLCMPASRQVTGQAIHTSAGAIV